MTTPHTLYLATGTNIGDRQNNLDLTNELIQERIGPILKRSSCYETEAWGITDQPDFLNQTLLVETKLDPEEVLQVINQIEQDLGRERKEKWGPRLIDIDILFFDDLVIKTERLTIPHPFLQERNFVLVPMLEIAPEHIHPVFNLSIEELYLQSKDLQEVIQITASNE